MNFPRDEMRPKSTNTGSQSECSKSCTRKLETATDLLKDGLGDASATRAPALSCHDPEIESEALSANSHTDITKSAGSAHCTARDVRALPGLLRERR